MQSAGFTVLNASIDILFLVDIIVNFRTTVMHPKLGEEIVQPKEIAKQYMKGRFWVDLLATVPID